MSDRIEGDPATLAAIAPVLVIVTEDEPTAAPPSTWEPDAHLDELRAEPGVVLVED